MADADRARAVVSFVLSEVLEEDVVKYESEDELEGLPALFLDIERTPAVRIRGYVEEVVANLSDDRFKRNFRLSRGTFEWLMESLKNCPELIPQNIGKGGRAAVPLEKQLLLTHELLGNQIPFRMVSEKYDLTESSTHRCFHRICTAIKNHLTPTIIFWSRVEDMAEQEAAFEEHRGFPGVLGAIDGCHIPISAPRFCSENYVNRKGWHSVNLQAVCNHDLKFINCYAGWPGSVHDARVLRNSPLFRDATADPNLLFPGNRHILGDSAYPLADWLLTPYGDNGHLTQAERNYNFVHSSTRMVIERAFGLLRARFRRLHFLEMDSLNDIVKVIIVACTLHNVCLMRGDHFFEEYDDEEEINSFQDIGGRNTNATLKRNGIKNLLVGL
ncbi:putative nuclease HARBI1 [Acropora muricata]|uniref:putative nuclease HARBI1 n=1 Tax=Acropora muricata TaxID=159855 RepID=UPI0034E4E998